MTNKRPWPGVFVALACCFAGCIYAAEPVEKSPASKEPATKHTEAESSSRFIRLSRDEKKQPIALETAIVRYAPKDRSKKAPIVDLVTAVHIGEKSYYEQLNKEFAGYDAVLYELVAPEGTKIPKGGPAGSGSLISMLQKAMKDVLELEFQLQMIDYTRANMVHADMSPAQFAESMDKRGESMIAMFLRMMLAAMAQQDMQSVTASDAQLLYALFDKNRAMALKRVMAEQFQSMEGVLSAAEGPSGSTLVAERDKIALEVLRKEMDRGKKKFAIFYGGGHMVDFDKRLREHFALAPVSTRWITAWNLKSPPPPKPAPPAKKP